MGRRAFISRLLTTGAAAMAVASRPAQAEPRRMVAVVAEMVFAPENAAAAGAALDTLAAATRREPGCLRYVVSRDISAAGRFHLAELWADRDALHRHFHTAHMTAFLKTGRRLGYAMPFLKALDVAGMSDLDTRSLLERPPP